MIGFPIQVLLEAFSLFSAIEEEIFIRVFAALVLIIQTKKGSSSKMEKISFPFQISQLLLPSESPPKSECPFEIQLHKK